MDLFRIEPELISELRDLSDEDLRAFAETQEDPTSDAQVELLIYVYFFIFARTVSMEHLVQAIHQAEGWVGVTPNDHPDRSRRSELLNRMLSIKLGHEDMREYLNGRISEVTGSIHDLNRAVDVTNMEVKATPQDHPNRERGLIKLGDFLGMRFLRTGSMDDINQAVDVTNMAVETTPQDHPDRARTLTDLGSLLGMRFVYMGSMDDLNRAIYVVDMAVEATPQDHPDRARRLINLGNLLGMRFKRTGSMDDINRAVDVIDMAVETTPQGHPDRGRWLIDLGSFLGARFERAGSMDDINRAVDVAHKAVDVAPQGHPDRGRWLTDLGSFLGTRFERAGLMDDLYRAVEVTEVAVEAIPQDHPDQARRLINLGSLLGMRFMQMGLMDDINRAVDVVGMAVKITPQDHPSQVMGLINLGSLLGMRFVHMGSMEDLNQAVDVVDMAVEATPQDHPDRARRLINLGSLLGIRFVHTGSMDDINRAVDVTDMAVKATPPDHPNLSSRLSTLRNWLITRFERTGSMEDINRAIDVVDMAVKATPQDHLDLSSRLINLGSLLGMRFKRTGSMDDINQAVDVASMAVKASPQDYSDRASSLINLGGLLGTRFVRTGSIEDINRAIDVTDMAVKATPQDHFDLSSRLINLGSLLGMRFKRTGSTEDINQAVDVTDMAVKTTPQDYPSRVMRLTDLGSWPSTNFVRTGSMGDIYLALDVTDMAVNATPQDYLDQANRLINLGSLLSMRFKRTGSIEDINRVVDVANMAVKATPQDHPDRASSLINLGSLLGTRFVRTGLMEDINQAVDVTGMAVEATPRDYPDRTRRLINLGSLLGMRFVRTGSMDDINRAVDVTDMAVKTTPQGHPDRGRWLIDLGSFLGTRFERAGSMDDLYRAVDVTDMAVEATPQDHPDRARRLINLGSLLGMRFERTGSIDDFNRAVDVTSMAVDAMPQGLPNQGHWFNNFKRFLHRRLNQTGVVANLIQAAEVARMVQAAGAADVDETTTITSARDTVFSQSHEQTHEVTPHISAKAIAYKLFADRSARSNELQDWIASVKQGISTLFGIKTKLPAIANTEAGLSELQGKIDMVAKAEDLISKLEESLPAIARLTHKLSKLIHDEVSEMRETLSESEIRYAEEGVRELRIFLERISRTWDARIFADLNDFCDLLDGQIDGQIDSVLTVTGSSRDAFANTAACYVSWCWGQRGMDILNWLSEFLSAARLSESSSPHTFRIHEERKGAGPVCIELQAQFYKESAAPASKCNTAIRVQWVEGRMEEYYVLVAEFTSQLAWIVAAFKEPLDKGLSFTRAKIEDQFPIGEPILDDENHCTNFRIVHEDTPDMAVDEDNGGCWHQLFTGLNVAIGFPIPTRPEGMLGVELPLSVMTSFAGVSYPVAYKGGFVLKGWRNALFPVRTDPDLALSEKPSALQWHLFVEHERSRLYMAKAEEKKPNLLPIKTKLTSTEFCMAVEQTERHFLGLYEDAKIHIGINASQADGIGSISVTNGLRERHLRSPFEWTRIFNISFGGGVHGASAGASTGVRVRTSKERQLSLNQQHNQRQLLDATTTNSTILFDIKTRVAWMLPQIYVVMRLVQAWTKTRYQDTKIDYPPFDNINPIDLEKAFREFIQQQAATEALIKLEDIFFQFATALDQLQDEEYLEPARNKRQLAGVDFAHLAKLPMNYSILTTEINLKSSGNWLNVLKSNWNDSKTPSAPYRVVTLFCGDLTPQPIQPRGQVCDTWCPPPVDQDYLITTIHCLKELARIYGSDPVKLSRDHFWVCGRYGPYDPCHGRSCNRLQRIVTDKQRDEIISKILSNSSYNAAVVFGGEFCVDPQRSCNRIAPY